MTVEEYTKNGEYQYNNFKEELLKFTNRPLEGSKLLEYGCGAGAFLNAALSDGIDAYGVEVNKEREKTYKRFCVNPDNHARWVCYDGEILPFASQTFDYVYSWYVLEHVSDLYQGLKEIVRVTKKDGIILLFTQDARSGYDGHAKMPWPPFLPKKFIEPYLEEWAKPKDGNYKIKTFLRQHGISALAKECCEEVFYITLPQILSVLQYYGMRVLYSTPLHAYTCFNESLDITSVEDARRAARLLKYLYKNGKWAQQEEICIIAYKSDGAVDDQIIPSEPLINHLAAENKKLKKEIFDLHNSRSWRITRPLRSIGRLLNNTFG